MFESNVDFEDEVALLLTIHLLDSIWESGKDAARRLFEPTGAGVLDGDGSAPSWIGSINVRVNEIQSGIKVLKRIASIDDRIKQRELLDLFFGPIVGVANNWGKLLQEKHGKEFENILNVWIEYAEKNHQTVADTIKIRTKNLVGSVSITGAKMHGRSEYPTALGAPTALLYLTLQMATWWLSKHDGTEYAAGDEKSRLHGIWSTDLKDFSPSPVPIRSHENIAIILVMVLTYTVDPNRHARKVIFAAFKGGAPVSMEQYDEIQTKLAGANKPVHLTDISRKAKAIWDNARLESRDRRVIETECQGRFGMKLLL